MKNKKISRKIRKRESFFGSRKMSIVIIKILEIMLVFTLLDYLMHTLKDSYNVPAYYFGNEVIYGTIVGFFVFLLIKNLHGFKKSLAFSAIMAICIQLVYLSIGHSLGFVLTFLTINFVIMFVVSYIGFRIAKI